MHGELSSMFEHSAKLGLFVISFREKNPSIFVWCLVRAQPEQDIHSQSYVTPHKSCHFPQTFIFIFLVPLSIAQKSCFMKHLVNDNEHYTIFLRHCFTIFFSFTTLYSLNFCLKITCNKFNFSIGDLFKMNHKTLGHLSAHCQAYV